MKKLNKSKRRNPPSRDRQQSDGADLLDWSRQQSRLEWVYLAILLCIGIYLSVIYFDHKAVPNSDFTAFVKTGQQILKCQVPSSFKRVPLLGMMQVAMGKLMFTSPYPVLTGALVLNGVLYTLSIFLMYKVSRFFLEPTGSFCLSLITSLNPSSLLMMVDPIAETAIVFFLLLTFYLIFKRSWWCYPAAMAASMVRYELFGLIGIAFLFDLMGRKGKRQKLTSLGLAFAASVPMLLWLIGTKMTKVEAGGHYLRVFFDVENRNGFKLVKTLWNTSFSALLQWPGWIHATLIERPATRQAVEAIKSQHHSFQVFWNYLTAAFFVLGLLWGFLKKQWAIFGVLLFWIAYVCVHMSQNVLLERYTVPVVWLTLLISAYGAVSMGTWAAKRLPGFIGYAVAGVGAVVAVIWVLRLWPAVLKTPAVSAASSTVVYAGLVLAAIALTVKQWLFRRKTLFADISLFTVVAVMIVSNQFPLSSRLGQGSLDIEFRRTAEWFLENASKTDRLATTLPGVVNLFFPEGQKNAVHTSGIAGNDLAEFAYSCQKRNVRYIAWDSRLGFAVNDHYYKSWGLKKTHPLFSGKDIGPFKFIKKIEANKRRYIHLYRLDFEKLPPKPQ